MEVYNSLRRINAYFSTAKSPVDYEEFMTFWGSLDVEEKMHLITTPLDRQ